MVFESIHPFVLHIHPFILPSTYSPDEVVSLEVGCGINSEGDATSLGRTTPNPLPDAVYESTTSRQYCLNVSMP